MPFPATKSDRPPPPKKGKSRSRRYHMVWCYREEPSNDDSTLYNTEVRSTNIGSAVTSLLKYLNEGRERTDPEFLRKSDLVVVEARVMRRGEVLMMDDDADEEDE